MRLISRILSSAICACLLSCTVEATATQSSPIPSGGVMTGDWRIPVPQRPHIPRLPVSEDSSIWVSFFSVYAGCQADPTEIILSTSTTSDCAYIHPTPGMDMDGDTFEVAARLQWSVDDPVVLSMTPLNGGRLASLKPQVDYFSSGGTAEPSTTVRFCADNACPLSASSCEPRVCGAVRVTQVVSIDGGWQFDGAPLSIVQDGRTFSSSDGSISDGIVWRNRVWFTWNGLSADGTIDSSRTYMTGSVRDAAGSSLGTWIAIR